ncbi:MAG TPA: retropepsin-like aspartic protease [Pseudomonadales bacterium]
MNVLHSLICALLLAVPAAGLAEDLRVSGQRLFLAVQVGGVDVEALLDSGAEMTLIDTALAERLGLELTGHETARGTGGEQPARFATGVDFAVAGVELQDRTVAVLDLSDVSRRLIGEPLAMVLGRELFDAGRFRLDVEGGRIERVRDDDPPAGSVLPLREHAGIRQIPVIIEGIGTWADFDLGNGSEMMLGRGFTERHGWLTPERHAGRAPGGGLGGEVLRDLVRLTSVRIAGIEVGPVIAAVDATGHASDANVGVAHLRRFVMTIDFPGERIWLTPRDAADPAAN